MTLAQQTRSEAPTPSATAAAGVAPVAHRRPAPERAATPRPARACHGSASSVGTLPLIGLLLVGMAHFEPVSARALASASLSIEQFTWYWYGPNGIPEDGGGDDEVLQIQVPGAAGTGAEQLIQSNPGAQDASTNGVEIKIAGVDDDEFNVRQRSLTLNPATAPNTNLSGSLDSPQLCVPPICTGNPAPNDFSPLSTDFTSDQYVNNRTLVQDFFLDATGTTNATGMANGGLRADISLPVPDPDSTYVADIVTNWDMQNTFLQARAITRGSTVYSDYDTYFKIEGVSQAMARLASNSQSNSVAEASLSFLLQVFGPATYSWEPVELNLSAVGDRVTGDPQVDPNSGAFELYSYNYVPPSETSPLGPLRLVDGGFYSVSVQVDADANATANSPPAGAPIPASPLLLLAGLAGLLASRRMVSGQPLGRTSG